MKLPLLSFEAHRRQETNSVPVVELFGQQTTWSFSPEETFADCEAASTPLNAAYIDNLQRFWRRYSEFRSKQTTFVFKKDMTWLGLLPDQACVNERLMTKMIVRDRDLYCKQERIIKTPVHTVQE